MATWRTRIPINDVLTDDTRSTTDKARAVARRLHAHHAFKAEAEELEDLVLQAEQRGTEVDPDEVDDVLAAIYDIADAERIWLGG